MTEAMLVPTDGAPCPIEINGLADLQKAVGGRIEAIDWIFNDEGMLVYANEEGKFVSDVSPNRAIFADRSGTRWDGSEIQPGDLLDILFGDFVVIGFDPDSGEDVDLTDEQMEAVSAKFGSSTVGSGAAAVLAMQLGIPFQASRR